ncbi:MAG: cell division FtsA domain-containing protein, partial [Saprospiraceae bacterium]|nr:cell division FtsA domain-containing protein [Saprospiraceae bacterium]
YQTYLRHSFGGNVITRDIREGTVMNEQAEKLKQKFGSALAEEIYDNRIITIPGFKGRTSKNFRKNLARTIQAEQKKSLITWGWGNQKIRIRKQTDCREWY